LETAGGLFVTVGEGKDAGPGAGAMTMVLEHPLIKNNKKMNKRKKESLSFIIFILTNLKR
jgi:hypothetical protein